METAKFDKGLKEDRNLDWGDSEFYDYKEVIGFKSVKSMIIKRLFDSNRQQTMVCDFFCRRLCLDRLFGCIPTQGGSQSIPPAVLSLVS